MKIIDLLNKIANGEEVPNKIKYGDYIWVYKDKDYIREDLSPNYIDSNKRYLLGMYNFGILNEEVEILEEECEECGKKEIYKDNLCMECYGKQLFWGEEDNKIKQDKIEYLEKELVYKREPDGFEHPDSEFPSTKAFFDKINEIIDYINKE